MKNDIIECPYCHHWHKRGQKCSDMCTCECKYPSEIQGTAYFSERGIPLVYWGQPPNKPTITVENYMKWYTLYVIKPNGEVTQLNTHDYDFDGGWGDHIPHPQLVLDVAKKLDMEVDDNALDMVAGRYAREHLKYDFGKY